ncbi:DJ-1/PfpI family protein [Aeromicrobium terrae]|uniref:DJ-1/PfpI family protein n=1 Tax=Aeromicrobium terrae TaxID=2498846 RepID=A0A5C8NFZ8_9ACTN|nr:DJ-1/PfpI family protein [Aeromicrobium terrae]TXL60729.1 DJ-1/PfpI family protein [Aeromicrobium terrae]
MQVAIALYPDFTSLDVMGPYEVFARLPETDVVFVAENPGAIVNDLKGVSVNVVNGLDDVTNPDVVLIGGGPGQRANMADGRLHEWLRTVDRTSTWTTSVCTGTLIMAATGLLKGRSATSHWGALDQLPAFGVTPSHERVVFDGHYASAAGVSAGIDLALTLSGRMLGDEVAKTVQLIIEYAPEPPYDSGSVSTASPVTLENAKRVLGGRFDAA